MTSPVENLRKSSRTSHAFEQKRFQNSVSPQFSARPLSNLGLVFEPPTDRLTVDAESPGWTDCSPAADTRQVEPFLDAPGTNVVMDVRRGHTTRAVENDTCPR